MNYTTDVDSDDTNREAANKLVNAHMSGDIVIVVGTCAVSYEGRAWKYLDPGKRSVVINPTGAVLVHDAQNVKPANWQPQDADTTITVDEDGDIVITATRTAPEEELYIRFTQVHKSIHYTPSEDYGEVTGTEDDMHEYIVDNPEFVEEQFTVLEHEKETKFGFIDVYGIDRHDTQTVIEVKRKKATLNAVDQLHRYIETIDSDRGRGILVAPSATASALSLLDDRGYEFMRLDPVQTTADS